MTNIYTEMYDLLRTQVNLDNSEEVELVDHILSKSDYNSIELYSKSNLTTDDAIELLQDNTNIYKLLEVVDIGNKELEVIITSIEPSKFSYFLAYEEPELATQLLDELLYYRKLGRI